MYTTQFNTPHWWSFHVVFRGPLAVLASRPMGMSLAAVQLSCVFVCTNGGRVHDTLYSLYGPFQQPKICNDHLRNDVRMYVWNLAGLARGFW